VFGLALSVASTVVLLRALEERGILDSFNGRIAVGWLVVEDLVTVLVLVLLPALAGSLGGEVDTSHGGGGDLWTTLAITLGQVTAFIVLMLVVGRKLFPWMLWQVARTGSRELFTLCVIAAAVGIAYAPPITSACRSRWAPSLPAWCCANRRWRTARPKNRCRCAMRSRCCSSSRSACCSSHRS
jgi:predicted Kef-type K+ transport protein